MRRLDRRCSYDVEDLSIEMRVFGASFALPQVLRTLCIAVHWHVGELWIVDSSAGLLRCAGSVSTREAAGPECETFTRISREMTPRLGEGFAGSIWANSKA